MKEKFCTTFNKGIKKKLGVLSANEECNANEYIEKLVNKEWEKFVYDVAKKTDKQV